jgi:5-methylcytosine-specific restriction endonuclease McrA
MHSLKSLSDRQLLNRLSRLVKQEQKLTLEILPHLIEVENRKLYRKLGYSSMFVYCTDGLGYSESSANRRIYAARALRKCPGAYRYLRQGRVNLGTLALAWQHIKPELLEEIRDKSYRQVQAIVSRFNPIHKHRDITRPVAVRVPAVEAGERQIAGALARGSSAPSLAEGELGEKTLRRGGTKCTTGAQSESDGSSGGGQIPARAETPRAETQIIKMHQVSCLLDDAVMQMLDRCKALLSGKYPCGMNLNIIITELASAWLEKNDPVERNQRRAETKKTQKSKRANPEEPSRHINLATRDAVYERDGGRCTYVGPDGRRCESTWDLEVHHDGTAYALGGNHSLANLRLLCAAHNRLEAKRIYGSAHMAQFEQFNRKIE